MIFQYKAKNKEGKIVRGNLEAKDLSDFYENLEMKELLPLGYREIKGSVQKVSYKLKSKDLVLFCRKVSTMLSAGMSITNCLDVMYTTETNKKLKPVYVDLYEWVKGGEPLSAAMGRTNGSFPALLINMMESGEESGSIDAITDKLSGYYERQAKIASKVKTASMYPKILAIVAVAVVMLLFTLVLPKIFDVFQGAKLPAITQLMLNISSGLIEYWYIVLAVAILLVIFFNIFLKLPKLKYYKDKFVILVPIVGPLIKKIYSARFASTLSILYSSGISLLNGIGLSMNVIDNLYIQGALNSVVEKVSTGKSLSETITEANVFDGLLGSMIKIGEESGSLDSILTSVSEYYESETDGAIDSLLAILEPVLLVVMAVIIGVVLVSVMLPIFGMYSQIG